MHSSGCLEQSPGFFSPSFLSFTPFPSSLCSFFSSLPLLSFSFFLDCQLCYSNPLDPYFCDYRIQLKKSSSFLNKILLLLSLIFKCIVMGINIHRCYIIRTHVFINILFFVYNAFCLEFYFVTPKCLLYWHWPHNS